MNKIIDPPYIGSMKGHERSTPENDNFNKLT